jgi:hypothetical protein
MPALFGYLVALVLLLGGGYAGLHWLASPDDVNIHRRIGEKPTARNLPKKSEFKEDRATAVPGEADAASGIGTTASAPAAMAAPQHHEGNETETVAKSGDPASGVNNDNAAAGGCMPIGVTARGADVFPIQCQALIERQRGSAPSAVPPQTTAAPEAVQSVELAKPGDSSAAMTRPAQPDAATTGGTSKLNPEPERQPAKPAEASRQGSRDAKHKDDAEHKDDAQLKDIASTPKQGEPRSESGVKSGKQDKRQAKRQERRNGWSSRSRPVMMVLRTIEFPDGHREQQLLPIGRARRMAVEAEDQW